MGRIFCPLTDKVLKELSNVSSPFVSNFVSEQISVLHNSLYKCQKKSITFECINQNINLYVCVVTKCEEAWWWWCRGGEELKSEVEVRENKGTYNSF